MTSAHDLATRYVALWNEPDADARRTAIALLWRPDGMHFVAQREVRGHAALEQRISGSHERNVRDNGSRFRARPGARRLQDVVSFNWEMLAGGDGSVLATGLEFLVLDADGRIAADYQFIDT